MDKAPDALRTISEVAELLQTPAHVLRFWETRFTQLRPIKRAGGRRYYRPTDVALLAGIRVLLHDQGMTIRGAQKILREQGVRHVWEVGGLGADAEAVPDVVALPVADVIPWPGSVAVVAESIPVDSGDEGETAPHIPDQADLEPPAAREIEVTQMMSHDDLPLFGSRPEPRPEPLPSDWPDSHLRLLRLIQIDPGSVDTAALRAVQVQLRALRDRIAAPVHVD